MDPTTTIIQFIGIVLFSANIPEDPGLHAIMPRIGHVHKSEIQTLPKLAEHDTGEHQVDDTAGIENHVAAILYRDSDRLYNTGGWKSDGVLANGWNYLALDGERVQFLTNHKNGAPAVPGNLPRAGGSSACQPQNVALGLRSEFKPPYSGAAAVVDIPEGQLSSCLTSNVNIAARIDTRLHLQTKGVLVITATKSSEAAKALVLKGDAVVFVANIPPYTLTHDTDLTVGDPHWTAYNDMLNGPCSVKPEIDQTQAQQLMASCDAESLGPSYVRAVNEPPLVMKMIDSGCSNTQWP